MVRTPYYEILINGKEISEDIYRKITKIQFKEPETGEQYAMIYIKDQDYSIQDGGLFVPDKTVCEILMGYMHDYGTVMNGIVDNIACDYPQSEEPIFEVKIKNVAYVMNKQDKNARYVDKTYSDIAIEIAKKYGLKYDVDDTSNIYNPKKKAGNNNSPAKNPTLSEIVVGGKAKMNGKVYANSYGDNPGVTVNREVTISKITNTSRVAPYLVDGTLGWAKRSDLTPIGSTANSLSSTNVQGNEENIIYQTGKSDYKFLKAIADKIGYDFRIDGTTLYFKKDATKNNDNPILLEYRIGECNLLNFKPSEKACNVKNSYASSNIDFSGEVIDIKAKVDFKEEKIVNSLPTNNNTKKIEPKYHVVKSGEYLIKIAKQYYNDGSKYLDIYNANASSIKMPGYVIFPGQKLLIP